MEAGKDFRGIETQCTAGVYLRGKKYNTTNHSTVE